MVTIYIDGVEHKVMEGKNLLDTCLSLGYDVPYFCYHPVLGSVGACRQCAVKKYMNENDTKGRIVMACMEPVAEGLRISITHPDAVEFRKQIIEGLMTNHPHDCPICDEGGECHLQDMTVLTGHNYRKFDFKKRTHRNQYLGPFINHEMNRCIQCYRCVRYYQDYTGGKDLAAFASRNRVYFGRHQEGVLESEFSGNLAEVCPTGVFTDKTLKNHYTRKWDLTNSPSVCQQCSIGCNIFVSERYGSVRRVLNRYNPEINGYFLCDRGRFGYEYVNSDKRIKEPLFQGNKTSVSEILSKVSAALSKGKFIGIGSPRASVESNFALRTLVGKDNFYQGISEKEHQVVSQAIDILAKGQAHVPSLKEIEQADAVFVLGEDVTNTAPMAALALRQAVKNKGYQLAQSRGIQAWNDAAIRNLAQGIKSPLFVAAPYQTKLEEVSQAVYHATPDEIAILGFAVASLISNESPPVRDLSDKLERLANDIASALKTAERPLIVTGTGSGSKALLEAAANISWGLTKSGKKAGLFITFPESNSMGLGLIDGQSLNAAIETITKQNIETVIILENNPFRNIDKKKADEALAKCKNIIVLDQLFNDITDKANIIIPSGTFTESDGLSVNNEGGAHFYRALPSNDVIKFSWQWIREILIASGKKEYSNWKGTEEVIMAAGEEILIFKDAIKAYLHRDFRENGQQIPRQTRRFSGRTAMYANVTINEPKPPQDNISPYDFSMEGYIYPPATMAAYYWAPNWNSVQALNKYQKDLQGELKDGKPASVRLLPENSSAPVKFFTDVPKSPAASESELLLVDVWHIFGSAELSSQSAAMAEVIPEASVFLSPDEAQRLQLSGDSLVTIGWDESTAQLKLKTLQGLPKGVIGISRGIKGTPFIEVSKVKIVK